MQVLAMSEQTGWWMKGKQSCKHMVRGRGGSVCGAPAAGSMVACGWGQAPPAVLGERGGAEESAHGSGGVQGRS